VRDLFGRDVFSLACVYRVFLLSHRSVRVNGRIRFSQRLYSLRRRNSEQYLWCDFLRRMPCWNVQPRGKQFVFELFERKVQRTKCQRVYRVPCWQDFGRQNGVLGVHGLFRLPKRLLQSSIQRRMLILWFGQVQWSFGGHLLQLRRWLLRVRRGNYHMFTVLGWIREL